MALTLDRVTLDLGKRRVLANASAAFAPGSITVILGPNGAGKTSLLRAAAGLIAPVAGEVAIDGRAIATLRRDERARMIGYLPQSAEVAWNMPARDVVALGRLPFRTGPAEDLAAVLAAMAATDTEQFAERRIGELSGGERARVLLARVLAGEPRWLLADEPLASLDPAHQLDLLDRLRGQAARGVGVVVVLHDLAQAARVADAAVLVADGHIVATGPAAEVLTPERLGALFGVRLVTVPGHPICIPVERIDG
ncbi:MAG: ABC transporter ATP-binding protein [Sphingomonas sp.]|uniref:ABC transporter ATP-binding protein n=1 Tax=Sphingomonas sp. TaxID=28214 RepID=UPI003F7D70BB